MSDKVVITGGAGFFGLHLAQRFAKTHDVVLYDIADFQPDEYPANVERFKGDVRNRYRLEKAFAGAKIVIHAAAGLPLLDRQSIVDINVRGTQNVLDRPRIAGVFLERHKPPWRKYEPLVRHRYSWPHPAHFGCRAR